MADPRMHPDRLAAIRNERRDDRCGSLVIPQFAMRVHKGEVSEAAGLRVVFMVKCFRFTLSKGS